MSGLRRTARSQFTSPMQRKEESIEQPPNKTPTKPSTLVNSQTVNVPKVVANDPDEKDSATMSTKRKFAIVWGKKSTKKHKTWQGDGTLTVTGESGTVTDEEGKYLGRVEGLKNIEEGLIVSCGGKDVQIIEAIE